jgi:hypothetical protein
VVGEVVCLELEFDALGCCAVWGAHYLISLVEFRVKGGWDAGGVTPALLMSMCSLSSFLSWPSARAHIRLLLGDGYLPQKFLNTTLHSVEVGEVHFYDVNIRVCDFLLNILDR